MATPVILPKLGQSVESCLIIEWKKQPGATLRAGEVLCEIETDAAVMSIESPAAGTLLATFFPAGAVAPVQVSIAAIGTPGEDVSALRPAEAEGETSADTTSPAKTTVDARPARQAAPSRASQRAPVASPRARRLADQHGIDIRQVQGTGPGGRIIERDIPVPGKAKADIPAPGQTEPRHSPVAKAMVDAGALDAPPADSGPRGQDMARDLPEAPPHAEGTKDAVTAQPLRGGRRRTADRMRESLQESAQLTLNRTVDACALQKLRALFKAADPETDLPQVSINDLLLYAVAQTLPDFPALNARVEDATLYEYDAVHLGFAVDTPRGLRVPVVRDAHTLDLHTLAQRTKALGAAVQEGSIAADDMKGGSFTVTNLGSLGIESFTPILNPPQVAMLGVGAIALKPVNGDTGTVEFLPHLHLSLTIDHQVVDVAAGARFLAALAQRLATLDQALIVRGATL